MSSHHIIREKQEPALLVLGMDGFDGELFGQLLEWSPTVIATSQTAEKIYTYGVKIDWIIADTTTENYQADVKIIEAAADNFANVALKHLINYNYDAVNIIADELLLNDYLYYSDKIDVVIFYDHKKIVAVKSGFSKWKPANEIIEILTPDRHLKIDGLELIADNRYKTTHDGFFSITFDQLFLFIAELL